MYTQDENNMYPGNSSVIPPSMRIATNGTYSATTIGFFQATLPVILALIAPTVTSLVSIILVIVVFVTRDREEPEGNRSFNPGDIQHLISAASAGGMNRTTFPGFDEIDQDLFKNVMIKLGPVNGVDGRTGFIDVNHDHASDENIDENIDE